MSSATIGSIVGVAFGCALGIGRLDGTASAREHVGRGSEHSRFGRFDCGALIASVSGRIWTVFGPHLRTRSWIRSGGHRSDRFRVSTVWPSAVPYTSDWLHRRIAFHWLMEGNGSPTFRVGGCGDVLVCAVAALLPDAAAADDANVRIVVAGVGSAVVLWAASAVTLLQSCAR